MPESIEEAEQTPDFPVHHCENPATKGTWCGETSGEKHPEDEIFAGETLIWFNCGVCLAAMKEADHQKTV